MKRNCILQSTKTARRKNERVIFFTHDVCCDNKEGVWEAKPPKRWYGNTNLSPSLLKSTSNATVRSHLAREVWGKISGPVKSDTALPTAHHCCDIFSVFPCTKSRRWAPNSSYASAYSQKYNEHLINRYKKQNQNKI